MTNPCKTGYPLFLLAALTIWFGIAASGVWRYDGETMTNFSEPEGMPSDHIWTIYKSKQGEVLVGGAKPAGVYRFNGKSFERRF